MANFLFDLYGVLIKHRTDSDRRVVERRLGIDAEHRQAFWDAYHDLREPLDRGTVSDKQWWEDVARASGTSFDIADAIKTETDTLLFAHEDAVAAARDLIKEGHRVGVLSNIPHVLATGLVNEHPWFDEFYSVTFSCDIHAIKPEPEAFYKALAALGTEPADTIFFDDTAVNVHAARELGMTGVLYRTVADIHGVS